MTKGKFRKETSAAQQKRKTILQTYLTSLVSLVLCVTMFFGTTAAWFTDTVETNQNQMYVGTLAVKLGHASYLGRQLQLNNGEYWDVEAEVDNKPYQILKADAKWEPGYTAIERFQVKEDGTLAFAYELLVDFKFADEGTDERKMQETLTQAVTVWNYKGTIGDNYEIPQNFSELSNDPNWEPIGTLFDVITKKLTVFSGSMDSAKVTAKDTTGADVPGISEHIIALHMDETFDGVVSDTTEEQYKTVQGQTLSNITISLVATQLPSENDAFGNTYDQIVFVKDAEEAQKALENATPGTNIQLTPDVDYGTLTITNELENVTISGAEDITALVDIGETAVLDNVTFRDFDLSEYNGPGTYEGAINIRAGADADITFENCSFAPNSGYAGVRVYEPTAELSFIGCQFTGGRYGVYDSGAPIAKAEFINCEFSGQSSWAIQFNGSGTDSVVTIDGCTFDGCNGGIIKVLGAPTAGSTFTFTNNTITGGQGHDGKDSEWFWISSGYAITCSGNTKDGAAWNPAVAEGIGK